LEESDRGWICNLAATKTTKGDFKYPQIDLTRFQIPGVKTKQKVLVHHLFWCYKFEEYIDANLHISHLDKECRYVECVQESKDLNESRKYCHKFGWYKKKEDEDRPRCPHWEQPCTGP